MEMDYIALQIVMIINNIFTVTQSKLNLYRPYFCNKIFPCFDQPDIKGSLSLIVIADDDW